MVEVWQIEGVLWVRQGMGKETLLAAWANLCEVVSLRVTQGLRGRAIYGLEIL